MCIYSSTTYYVVTGYGHYYRSLTNVDAEYYYSSPFPYLTSTM